MDAGLQLVGHLFREMKIDEEWAVRGPRGFTWWAGELAQHVWADPPFVDLGVELCRVHVQTDVLTDFPATADSMLSLAVTTGWATMSGPVLGEGGMRSVASAYIHAQTLRMRQFILPIAALIQVTSAHIDAEPLATLTNSRVASSGHPTSGKRLVADDRLNVIKDVYLPFGQEPSRYTGQCLLDAAAASRSWGLLTNADATGLTSEVPMREGTALLQLFPTQRNPRLGNGMLAVTSMPHSFAAAEVPEMALRMNQRESGTLTRSPFLGSWCPHPSIKGTLSYVSFYPNVLGLDPSIVTPLLQYMAGRAKWFDDFMAKSDG